MKKLTKEIIIEYVNIINPRVESKGITQLITLNKEPIYFFTDKKNMHGVISDQDRDAILNVIRNNGYDEKLVQFPCRMYLSHDVGTLLSTIDKFCK